MGGGVPPTEPPLSSPSATCLNKMLFMLFYIRIKRLQALQKKESLSALAVYARKICNICMQSFVIVCPPDRVNSLHIIIVSYYRRFGRKIDVPVINRVHKVTLNFHCCHRWGLYVLIVP